MAVVSTLDARPGCANRQKTDKPAPAIEHAGALLLVL